MSKHTTSSFSVNITPTLTPIGFLETRYLYLFCHRHPFCRQSNKSKVVLRVALQAIWGPKERDSTHCRGHAAPDTISTSMNVSHLALVVTLDGLNRPRHSEVRNVTRPLVIFVSDHSHQLRGNMGFNARRTTSD